jgi:hypothetical protein
MDELVVFQCLEAQGDPGKEEKIRSDVRSQRPCRVGVGGGGDLVADRLGRRAFEEEMKVGGLAEKVLRGLGSTDEPIHIRGPVAARHVQGKLDALSQGFEGTGDEILKVRDDVGRRIHLHVVKGWGALSGFGAQELAEGEVR